MVKGGYYKLLVKNTDIIDHSAPAHSARCSRLGRLKVLILLAVLTIIIFICGISLLNPSTKSVSSQLNSATAQLSTGASADNGSDEADDRMNIRYKHTRRKLPSCLIIGARKAGTRALLTFLNLHPQIITAKQEEHFFDDHYERGLEWYRKAMPYSFPEQITMEKTPAYFVGSKVPERVFRMNSTIRILLIVRDPVQRAISDYNQIMLKKNDQNKPIASFEELAMDENGEVNESYNAIKRSVYAHYMARWLHFFPLKQFHIVNGEGLVDDPVPHIFAVEDFLDIEHRITNDNFYFNKTRGFYCIRNETMEKCLNPSKGRPHPFVRPEVMNKLRAYFRPYNEKFYELVHRNFGWQ